MNYKLCELSEHDNVGLRYFHQEKRKQFATVTYLTILSTLNMSNKKYW